MTGTVRWFSDSKGYGFIERDLRDGETDLGARSNGATSRDVFVHHSAIIRVAAGERASLTAGDRVEFSIDAAPKGPTAKHVVRLEQSADAPRRAARC